MARPANSGSSLSFRDAAQPHDVGLHPSTEYVPSEQSHDGVRQQMNQNLGTQESTNVSKDGKHLPNEGGSLVGTLREDINDNSLGKMNSQERRSSGGSIFAGLVDPLRRTQTRLRDHAQRSRFHGWRMGVLLGCCMSILILCCNIALLVVGTTHKSGYDDSEDGIVTLLHGDEAMVTRYNTGFHVLINVFSSILLAGSNYAMQVISSPNREEIDKAHRRNDWLAIGLLSPRNWRRIARKRALLALILGLSSVPLHLFYNATIFKVVVLNEYLASAIDVQSSNYTEIASNTSYVRLTNDQWKSAFAGTEATTYAELVLAFDEIEITSTYNNTLEQQDSFDHEDLLLALGFNFVLADRISESDHLAWRERVLGDPGVSLHITHAFALPARSQSRVQLSLHFIIVVISVNAFKLLIMLTILVTDRSSYIVTLGDAAASFLSRPDPVTEWKCLLEDEKLGHENRDAEKMQKANNAQIKDATDSRGHMMLSNEKGAGWHLQTLSYFALIRHEQARCTLLAILIFIFILIAFVATTGGSSVWSWGTSSGGALSFGREELSASATLQNAWLANLPQLLLSFCYMNINSFCTAMASAKEWNNLAYTRKSLHVSEPRGQQRTTYFLQLSYRWSVPLIVLSAFLHWLLSQTFFLVRIDVFNRFGALSVALSRLACGVSALCFLVLFLLFLGLCITIRHLASRKLVTGLPQAASNSLIISAACHAPSDEVNPHLKPVQWGVVEGRGMGETEHCSLSARPVTAPCEGKMYY